MLYLLALLSLASGVAAVIWFYHYDSTGRKDWEKYGRELGEIALVLLAGVQAFAVALGLYFGSKWVLGWLGFEMHEYEPVKFGTFTIAFGAFFIGAVYHWGMGFKLKEHRLKVIVRFIEGTGWVISTTSSVGASVHKSTFPTKEEALKKAADLYPGIQIEIQE